VGYTKLVQGVCRKEQLGKGETVEFLEQRSRESKQSTKQWKRKDTMNGKKQRNKNGQVEGEAKTSLSRKKNQKGSLKKGEGQSKEEMSRTWH